MTSYGRIERQYAEPFADALATDLNFRSWVLNQTEFAEFANSARLLHEEMGTKRSKTAQNWWRSHYTESCRCLGCRGKETDLLAVFEVSPDLRFAVHFEVKHAGDKFEDDEIQAAGYPIRASCWVARPPKAIIPHKRATTALLYSEKNAERDKPYLLYFRTLITFESIASRFPNATITSPLDHTPVSAQ